MGSNNKPHTMGVLNVHTLSKRGTVYAVLSPVAVAGHAAELARRARAQIEPRNILSYRRNVGKHPGKQVNISPRGFSSLLPKAPP